jgi:hypothetical protein
MKMNRSIFVTARAILSALLFVTSLGMIVLSLNVALNTDRALDMKRARPVLAGPEGYFEFLRQNPSLMQPVKSGVRRASAAVAAIPPAPEDSGPKLGFENFEAPGVLTQVTTSSQGQPVNTVEYIAHDAGEPSIGVNWNSTIAPVTGMTAFQSDLQTLFVTFDDSCALTGPKANWVNRPAPTSQGVDQDPIGFVDRVTGRTFAAQLTLTSPTCKTSYTDDDGMTWVPTQGFGIASGIDHQTLGGGNYHAPLVNRPPPAYPRAVYYCSQLPQAACARSDDGGLTFGPVVPIDPPLDANCIGIHGHVKVAPDGTVFVPTNNCNGNGSVIVSLDNGITWAIHHVPGTTSNPNIIDAQVAFGDDNTAYFIMSSATATGSQAVVATSTDRGVTWTNIYDVGAVYGLQNVGYPYVTAADPNRAAVAFLGSTTSGDESANGFTGVWHLYVAATFDGGAHWTTTDATPNAAMQRGCFWAHGGANICRNLLDFIGATVDKQGRIEVAYVNGCADGACEQATSSATRFTGNGYTARGVIARQSSGRRLVASFDPPISTSPPGMPSLNVRRVNGAVHLGWSEADSGNLMINNYQVLRGTATGTETLLTTVAGTQTGGTYNDFTASDPTKTYFYKVVAFNSAGGSCPNNEIAAPFVGDTCTGLILQKTPPNHPEQTTQGQTPASLAIDYIGVAEPPNSSVFTFKMKTTSLAPPPAGPALPPNSRWRIVWNSESATGQQYYVGMTTDANSVATFEYGHIATAVVGLVVGVPTETKEGTAVGSFATDGTITITVPKSAVGNPQPRDLLGAVNGRTFTGDTPQTNTLERSNALMDHTFVKGQRDNGHPAATYELVGNVSCSFSQIVPVSVVSRKTHGSAGDFDVDLLNANPGIECRAGPTSGAHTVIVTFGAPVTVNIVKVTPGSGGTATMAGSSINGSVVTINLTGVSNAQTLNINLTGVSDGMHSGDVSIPMGVLLGDVDGSGRVDSTDTFLVRQDSLQTANPSNFRADVDTSGRIDSNDVFITRQQSLTSLP